MANNSVEIEDFTNMMTRYNIEKETAFGNLHFKLRVLNLSNNPMKDFQFKVDKYLDSFYDAKRYPKLMILADSLTKSSP